MPYKPLSRDEVIEAIRRFAAQHGRPPTSHEWLKADSENNYPNRNACVGKRGHAFATWTEAVKAAGFRPLKPGQNKYALPRQRPTGSAAERRAQQRHALLVALERNGR